MSARHTKHTDLFLVRFWTQDAAGASDEQRAWRGRVQRAVDGESHEFHDWDTLVETLRQMLAATSPELAAGGLDSARKDTSGDIATQGDNQ